MTDPDDEKARLIAKIRRGLKRLDVRFYPHGTGLEGPIRFYETATERDRRELEAAGFPDGPDYEALILAEAEEWFED